MKRPKCGMCNGKGKREETTFSEPRRTIERLCGYCHGKGTAKLTVDLYDVLDHLEEIGAPDAARLVAKRFVGE